MADMTMATVTDGTAATAATANANMAELEKSHGLLDSANLESKTEVSKEMVRRGTASLHTTNAALTRQQFEIDVPGTSNELLEGEEYFIAGDSARVELPPGQYGILVTFVPSGFSGVATSMELLYREDGGAWNSVLCVSASPSAAHGTIYINSLNSSYDRVFEVAIRYTAGTAPTVAYHGTPNLFSYDELNQGQNMTLSVFRI